MRGVKILFDEIIGRVDGRYLVCLMCCIGKIENVPTDMLPMSRQNRD